ncbi:MAG TPA: YfbM family protein [Symbiobacteriaceae bacterium]|nr:YfbM family protein [Symbiobacteriaceae bacterium]
MGMIGAYKRLSAEQLQELLASPETITDLLYPDDDEDDIAEDPSMIDIDKAWHGLHFLLNGDPWSGEGPLFSVVLGGTEIGEDLGYGPARYLTPEEVKETAAALDNVTDVELRAKYDPAAFAAADIYPQIWGGDAAEALEYIMQSLTTVRAFFREAAEHGEAVLLYMM